MDSDFSEMMNQLSENARFALQKADLFSKKYNNGYMGTEHILLGILSQDASTGARILASNGVTLDKAEKALDQEAAEVNGNSAMAMMSLSEAAVLTIRMASHYAMEKGVKVIGTEYLLYALICQTNSRGAMLLIKMGVELDDVMDALDAEMAQQMEREQNQKLKKDYKRKPLKWLKRFGTDLTDFAKDDKLDAVIGREREIERVVTVLSRRTKSNPVLIGEAGVGKTAIVEGLAERMVNNDVPGVLIGKRIIQVDLSTMVAGTKFRGSLKSELRE